MNVVMTQEPVYFGGVSLNIINGWMTTGVDTFRYPNRDVKNYPLAYTNKSVTTSGFYKGRPINVRGVLMLTSRNELDTAIGELRALLEPINQTLQVPISGIQRKFNLVTVANIGFTNVAGGYIAVDIEFTTTDPFTYALQSTEVLNVLNLTSGNKSYPVTFEGTARQVPIFTYQIDSLTNGTNKTVTLINPISPSKQIAVQKTWVAGEVLIVDCLNQTVQISGIDTEFTGNFPDWARGSGFINYTDDFTARQVDINVTYTKRYL